MPLGLLGYNLSAIAESAGEHVRALVEGSIAPPPELAYLSPPTAPVDAAVDALSQAFSASIVLSKVPDVS